MRFPRIPLRAVSLAWLVLGVSASALHAADSAEVQAHVRQGDAHRNSGEPAKALEEYQKALAIDETNADVYGRMGHALLEMGNGERAAKIFERQILLAPKDCGARAGLSEAYLSQGLPDQAVKTCEDALKQCPENAGIYANLGRAYAGAQYPIEAIEALRRAVELDPKDVRSYEGLANLCFDRNLLPESAGAYEALLARPGPGMDDARKAAASERLGTIYHWAGACERAVPHWEAAVASTAADAAARARSLEGLAGCRAELGETSQAIQLFEKLIAEQPKRPDHYYRLGDLLIEAGRPSEALAIAGKGKGVDVPCSSQAHCLMGRAYEKLGGVEHFQRAEREFQQAVACGDPRFTDYAKEQAARMQTLVKAGASQR